MKLSMGINYSGGFKEAVAQVVELEKVGLDQVWIAEAYSFDAVSQLGFIAAKTEKMELQTAILPMYSRTPTNLAMTAAGLDYISGGRAILGIGASGPQVIEGFHGVKYDFPLGRAREAHVRETAQELLERDAHLEPGDVAPHAEVGADAEGEMRLRPPGDVERLGILEDLRVSVRRAVVHHDLLALADLAVADLRIAQGRPAELHDRRHPAQDLLDGLRQERRVAAQAAELYRETPASLLARTQLADQLTIAGRRGLVRLDEYHS